MVAKMKTLMILLAQYDGLAVIPVEMVCRDYFRHLTPVKFWHKQLAGEIDLPVVRIEGSQKAAKGVHVTDLADAHVRALKYLCEGGESSL